MKKVFVWFETRIAGLWNTSDFDTHSSLAVMRHLINQIRATLLALSVVGALLGAIDALIYYSLGHFVDRLSVSSKTMGNRNIEPVLGIVIIIGLVRPLLGVLASLLGDQTIQSNFSTLTRWRLHSRLIGNSVRFFQTESSGSLSSKVWLAGQSAVEIINSGLQILLVNLGFLGSTLFILTLFHWSLAIIVFVWVTLFVAQEWYFVPLTKSRAGRSAHLSSIANGRLSDTYAHAATLKLYPSPSNTDEYVKEGLLNFNEASRSFLRSISLNKISNSLLGSLAVGVAILDAAFLWNADIITLGNMAAVSGLCLRLDSQLGNLMFMLSGLYRSIGSFSNATSIVRDPPDIEDHPDAVDLGTVAGQIGFHSVSFAYARDCDVLTDVSFRIEPGSAVAIVGPSGAGKSTLAHLLLRLYDVDQGKVTVDGNDVRLVTQRSLRSRIGLVSQDAALLHRSILENIAIGRPSASKEEIVDAARRARALDFIEGLTDGEGRGGFNTMVGERGLKLSGGQRQRIALARLFLKNPDVLVLDEATSSLDGLLDGELHAIISELKGQKTIIVITHRMTHVMSFDRIIVIDSGRICEDGTPRELLASNGIFRKIHAASTDGIEADVLVATNV